MLMNSLADQDFTDFQQLEPWRRLAPLVAHELVRVTGQNLVPIQSVLDESFWRELGVGFLNARTRGGAVVHVVLEADESIVRKRIAADENELGAAQWRLAHLATYAEARTWLTSRADLVLDTSHLTPVEAAESLWRAVAVPSGSPE